MDSSREVIEHHVALVRRTTAAMSSGTGVWRRAAIVLRGEELSGIRSPCFS
jgi:hypothetical protein